MVDGHGQSAEQLAGELKAESDRLLHIDPGEALTVAQRIGQITDRPTPTIRALGKLAEADALRQLGRYLDATHAYEQAAQLYAQQNDDVGWARTRIGATLNWRYTGVTPDELQQIERARDILEKAQLWVRLARLEQHAGVLLCELGQLDGANLAYQRALEAARKLVPRDPAQEARIIGNLALVWQRQGEYEGAEAAMATSLSVFEEHGHIRELATGKSISAQLLVDQGHYSRALDVAVSSRRALRELGDTINAAFVGRVAAHCLLSLNRVDEAASLASEVIDEFESAGAGINVAGTLLLRSAALRRQRRHAGALDDLDRADRIFAASECLGWVAVVRGERAAVLAEVGQWQQAAEHAEVAARELAERGHVVNAAQAGLVRASAQRASGKPREAETTARDVLASIGQRGVPWLEYPAWRLLADLALEDGRRTEALSNLETAIAALEQLQGRILTEARATFLQDKVDAFELAVLLCLELGEDARAFDFAERAKSRALVDALAGRLDIRIRPRTGGEQRLQEQLTRLRRQHEQLTALQPVALTQEAEPPELQAGALAACERQINSLLDELRLGNVADLERVALLQGKTYPLELDPDTALVEYFAAGDDLVAFVKTAAGVNGYRLAGARPRVERLVPLVHLAMRTASVVHHEDARLRSLEASVQNVLKRLHLELVAPLAERLGEGLARLAIVPHGSLHRLPFAALFDGDRYLIQRFEIVVGPSASALAFCRRPLEQPRDRTLVVANSNSGALPGAVGEARDIAELTGGESLLEAEATRERFVEEARQADVIHIATHGLARVDAPLFSYLRLNDSNLTALDCFELELNCSLVTLSACETGRAEVVPGDEQLGLPRALLYAGARSVVQTLWRVDDACTAQLMTRFYLHLRTGRGRGEALRQAQLEILTETTEALRSHPFFWAAPVLVGDWGPVDTIVSHG